MPTSIRSAGVATAYTVMHCIMICIVQVTPIALEKISWRYFVIFLIMNCVFIVIFYFFYPETKGKTLEEMNAVFGDEVSRNRSLTVLKNIVLTRCSRLLKLSKKPTSICATRSTRCSILRRLSRNIERPLQ
jgi:hypothetical protein